MSEFFLNSQKLEFWSRNSNIEVGFLSNHFFKLVIYKERQMSEKVKFIATKRQDLGKGASRRLRRANVYIPAIIYGQEVEPQPISVEKNEFYRQLAQNEALFSQILDLEIDGTKHAVIIRDMQRHPYKPFVQHIDFQAIKTGEALVMSVPLHFLNEEECDGVKNQGGSLMRLLTEIEISALPKNLPEAIEVDVRHLELGATLHTSDLKLPEGVEIVSLSVHDHDLAVANVVKTGGDVEEEEQEQSPEVPASAVKSDKE